MKAPRRLRCRRDTRASSVLPEDALYEILLRLPGKDVCRLRAVCRPWRCLLSEPHFTAAHAARHPKQPLVVVGYVAKEQNGRVLCDIVDLSGRVLKRVLDSGEEDDDFLETKWVMYTHGTRCRLLNLTTGAVHALPDGLAAEHAADQGQEQEGIPCYGASILFGLVPSTGEYKVLRMINADLDYPATRILYEVLTIDGSSQARWRGKHAPPYDLEFYYRDSSVVICCGIVYFLLAHDYWDYYDLTERGLVGSFDLETEKWRSSIRGPLLGCHKATLEDIKPAALSGCLALCCRQCYPKR